MFKDYFRAASSVESNGGLSDPFFCMNISCPTNSYDVNIEPAKDDVLFAKPDEILDLAEQILKDLYGDLPESHAPKQDSDVRPSMTDGIQLLMNGKRPIGQPVNHPTPFFNGQPSKNPNDLHQRSLFTSEGGQAGAAQTGHRFTEPSDPGASAEDGSELKSMHVSNPWTLTKMNAPIRQRYSSPQKEQHPTTDREVDRRLSAGHIIKRLSNHSRSPSLSSSSRRSPVRSEYVTEDSSSPIPFPYPLSARRGCGADETFGPDEAQQPPPTSALDSWMTRSSAPSAAVTRQLHDHSHDQSSQFMSAAHQSTGTPLSDIPFASPTRQSKVSSRKQDHRKDRSVDPERTWFGRVHCAPSCSTRKRTQPHEGDAASIVSTAPIHGPDETESSPFAEAHKIHPDLALTLDYERRKADAVQRHRLHVKQQKKDTALAELVQMGQGSSLLPAPSSSPQTRSPHHSRYEKAVAALRANEDAVTADLSPVSDSYERVIQAHDVRSTLIRSLDQPESQILSNGMPIPKLPFETIARGESTRVLVQTIKVDGLVKPTIVKLLARSDPYISDTGDETAGFAFISRTDRAVHYAKSCASALVKILKTSTPDVVVLERNLQDDIEKALTRINDTR